MTRTKLSVLIALKSLLVTVVSMAISLYISLIVLPTPSIFNVEKNPNPSTIWGKIFFYWILILAIVGLALIIKNKFISKTAASNDSPTTLQPLLSAWVIFLVIAIPSSLLTIKVTNYFSPTLRNHIRYHLSEAVMFNDDLSLGWLLIVADKKQLSTLLDQAIQSNSDACLKILGLAGVVPNKETLPFLMVQGGATGNNKMIQLMIGYKVSVNTQTSYGQTPLISAIENDKLETAQFLIKSGADVNLTPQNSYPPLILALLNDNNEMVKILLKAGVDVKNCKLQKEFSLARKVPSEDGQSILKLSPDSNALMLAAASANIEAIKMLLAAGIDANAANSNGYTALMCAKANACAECEQLLTAAGAKP